MITAVPDTETPTPVNTAAVADAAAKAHRASWGFGWGDDAIDAKTRSLMNLAMIGGLGKMHEWEIHCRGAIKNGVTVEQIRAAIHIVGIYCGVPQALECFRAARKVLREEGLL